MRHAARIALCLLIWGAPRPATLAQTPDKDLLAASLEELTQIQVSVSSFARKDEALWTTPAAVFVITKEDIARSAVSSVPELLRMVPGLQVAQTDASTWAVSVRGFNSIYASKVLVLVDGRTLYSEVLSGVHWDEADLPLQDIERIEVIRGPGAAVWGTNAVNGVINIITKKTQGTMGLSVESDAGRIGETENVRYGGMLRHGMDYRVFASYIQRNPFDSASGVHAFDGEDTVRGGGRIDWRKSASDWITLNGDLYRGRLKTNVVSAIFLGTPPEEHQAMEGAHLLSRWEHKTQTSDMALQAYVDDQRRHELSTFIRIRTFDVDYQNHRTAGSRNDLVWGSEFRLSTDHEDGGVSLLALPDYRNYLVDGFVQDEMALIRHKLTLTLGSKIQGGTLAGFQVQPSARILWAPSNRQSMWTAISRAAVAPSIEDTSVRLPILVGLEGGLPVVGILYGNKGFVPETVVAYEFGYRGRITNALTVDVAGFINDNRRIQSLTRGDFSFVAAPTPHLESQFLFTNGFKATTAGVESSLAWKPLSTSRFSSLSFQGSYVWMQPRITQTAPGSVVIIDAWSTPHSQASGSVSWNFARRWSATSFLMHVGPLEPPTPAASVTAAYNRLDFHLSRKVGRFITLDAGGTNLLTPRHYEFAKETSFIEPSEIPRSLFLKAAWSF